MSKATVYCNEGEYERYALEFFKSVQESFDNWLIEKVNKETDNAD